MHKISKWRLIPALTAAATGAALLAHGPAPASASVSGSGSASASASCTTVRLPVSLAAGGPKSQTVSGTLCTPESYGGPAKRVDLLVHGGTYNSAYWNWPRRPYSYVHKTVADNRAALAIDRLGTGRSTRPLSAALTLTADAHVVHQLVQWLRANGFDEVTLIGHSLGSMVSIAEAAAYGDVDRLVVTGVVHPPGIGPGLVPLFGSFYPALLDPRFAGRVTDPGYLTTRPGTRAASFYRRPPADPAVIAEDEASKDLMSGVELAEAAARLVVPVGLNDTNRVRAPVLVVVGQYDTAVCGLLLDCSADERIRANEAPYYTAARSLTGMAIPGTGHSLTLHPSAGTSFARISRWIDSH